MGRKLILTTLMSFTVLTIALSGLGLLVSPAKAQGAIGRDQRVGVAVCQYASSPVYTKTAQIWAAELNLEVNGYYEQATRGQSGRGLTTFEFIPVPGNCRLPYTYADTAPGGNATCTAGLPGGGLGVFSAQNDPLVMCREIPDAIEFTLNQQADFFDDIDRFLVIVNQNKRARSTIGTNPFFIEGHGIYFLSAAILWDNDDVDNRDDYSTFAHELGHQLGLPDLYRYGEVDPGSRYVEAWGQMGFDQFQNFTAYSRLTTGWLNAGVQDVTVQPGVNREILLHPTNTSATVGVELIRIPMIPPGPAGHNEYFIESRPLIHLDETLSPPYTPGVLVTTVRGGSDPGAQFAPGLPGPVLVQPRQRIPISGLELTEAAFRVGDTFTDAERGLQVSVVREEPGYPPQTYRVRVEWTNPQQFTQPDIVAQDVWLDNETNGFNTYWMPFIDPPNNQVPATFGDPVATAWRAVWDYSTFPPSLRPQLVPSLHFLGLQAANVGDGPAENVQGRVYLLDPLIPASFNLADPATLAPYTQFEFPVSFGDIPAEESRIQRVALDPNEANNPIALDGPFLVAFYLDQLAAEPQNLNNFYNEPFLMTQVAPGSPYQPIDLELPVRNLNRNGQAVALTFPEAEGRDLLKRGWVIDLNQTVVPLGAGDVGAFKVHVQPADPAVEKPGQMVTLPLKAWLDYGDSWIPVGEMPLHMILSRRTNLNLTADVQPKKVALGGQLTYRADDGSDVALAGATIFIDVNSTTGQQATLSATTDSNGFYNTSVPLREGTQVGIMAQYFGSVDYQGSHSDPVVAANPAKLIVSVEQDSTIHENEPRRNDGASKSLLVGRVDTSKRSSADMATLLQFDLSDLPSNAVVIQAQLELEQTFDEGADPFEVVPWVIKEPWDEHSLTWQNRPTIGPASDGPTLLDRQKGAKLIDLSATVTNWVAGAAPNYGVMLTGDGSTIGSRQFASREAAGQAAQREASGAAQPPAAELTIEYILIEAGNSAGFEIYLPITMKQ